MQNPFKDKTQKEVKQMVNELDKELVLDKKDLNALAAALCNKLFLRFNSKPRIDNLYWEAWVGFWYPIRGIHHNFHPTTIIADAICLAAKYKMHIQYEDNYCTSSVYINGEHEDEIWEICNKNPIAALCLAITKTAILREI